MSHILDYLLHWSGLTLALGAAVAAFLYLPPPFKLHTVYACLGLALAFLVYDRGFASADAKCRQATATYQAAITARDATIQSTTNKLATILEEARKANRDTASKVAAYEKKLSAKGACPLSDADRRRLLSIGQP